MATESWPGVLRGPELRAKVGVRKQCLQHGYIHRLRHVRMTSDQNSAGLLHCALQIDLDTIETSNLNRQFLFRKQHVGQSKASTAASVIKGIKPAAAIVPHHANVKEQRFGVDYIQGFSLVLNGLDNLEARRHVNRLAMAARVPLVESGTAGYLGQVTVHVKGATECFECAPKAVPKSFPICTLRNTPDKPIHCVVWAKDLLFPRLFGKVEEVTGRAVVEEATDLDDQSGAKPPQPDPEAPVGTSADAEGGPVKADNEQQGDEDTAPQPAADEASFFVRGPDEAPGQYARRIFTRMFTQDIQRLAAMKDLWKSRQPPIPLDLGALLHLTEPGPPAEAEALAGAPESACRQLGLTDPNKPGHQLNSQLSNTVGAVQQEPSKPASSGPDPASSIANTLPPGVWSVLDAAAVFVRCIELFLTHRQDQLGSAVFDKDDDLAVEFVTAASNLRAMCYAIPTQSLFAAKGMAGNIIHAIASTNAIISGLIVVEALKLLAGCQPALRSTYLHDLYPGCRSLLGPSAPAPPNPACLACGKALASLRVNLHTFTLSRLLDEVIKKRLAVNVPMLMAGGFMYEEGEGLEEDEVEAYRRMLALPLAQLPGGALAGGGLMHVSDESQAFTMDLLLQHQEAFDELEVPEGFILVGAGSTQPAPAPAPGPEPPVAAGIAAAAEGAGPGPVEKESAASSPGPAAGLKYTEDAGGVVVLEDSGDEAPRDSTKQVAADAPHGLKRSADAATATEVPAPKKHKQQARQDGEADVVVLDDD
ncbi:hypothetical protein QJQ45_021359 [Haematococcus lacustris]|nr:hypothetical protein QJQ45_021359 [Haematococcus lacustris]